MRASRGDYGSLAGRPGACWVCDRLIQGKPVGGRNTCGDPLCAEVRRTVIKLRAKRRRQSHCRICGEMSVEGGSVCERHRIRRAPCIQCGAAIPHHHHQGRPSAYCAACRPKRTTRARRP